jgi:hypothetical protein
MAIVIPDVVNMYSTRFLGRVALCYMVIAEEKSHCSSSCFSRISTSCCLRHCEWKTGSIRHATESTVLYDLIDFSLADKADAIKVENGLLFVAVPRIIPHNLTGGYEIFGPSDGLLGCHLTLLAEPQ